jgi:signal transduction histidine kinase
VEITDASGERFEETSSREGLVENSAYRELQLFIQRGLIALALRVASARGKKLHAGGPRKLRSGMEVAEQIVSSLGANLDSDTANDIRRLGEASDELERELRMMRVLATLGLTLAEFTHEVALGFTALGADVENLRDQIESNPEAARLAARVERHVSSLQSYIDYFENTARDNVSAEVQPLDVGDAVREFEELCAARNARQHIKMNIHLKHHVLRVRPMHVSELSSILTNLYTNAAKAIRTARVAGQIDISVRREANAVVMEFSDNGCGVKEANRELIFEPFFTTTSDHDVYASDADHVRGMGLGLKIVRDIVESNGGTINLSHAKRGYTTTFRIDLPEANANVS